MLTTVNFIKYTSSRVALWKTLHSKSTALSISACIPILQNKTCQFMQKPSLQFSTSKAVASSASHDHTKIWVAEKALSVALIALLPTGLMFPNPTMDYAIAVALTMHIHWGIEAIAVDYVRPSVVGEALSRAAIGGIYVLSMLTLGGLFYFNYSDVGLCQAIRMLWKL